MTHDTRLVQKGPILRWLLWREERVFEFCDEKLAVRVTRRKGVLAEQECQWQLIPAKKHFHYIAETEPAIPLLVLSVGVVAFTLIFLGRSDFGAERFFLTSSVIVLFVMIAASLLVRNRSTLFLAGNQQIIVHRNAMHDRVVEEIIRRRQNYFMQFAAIDTERSVRDNLKRLRWLVDIDVLPPERLRAVQREIAPSVGWADLARKEEGPVPLGLRQKRNFIWIRYEMLESSLKYEFKSLFFGSSGRSISYSELPPPSAAKEMKLTSWRLFGAIFIFGFLGLLGIDLWVDPAAAEPMNSFALLMLALVVLFRTLVAVSTASVKQLLPGVVVLTGAKQSGAQILSELDKRRTARLLAYADPDPLLTVAEQTERLSRLQQNGLIDATRASDCIARAAAINLPELDQPVNQPRSAPEIVLH